MICWCANPDCMASGCQQARRLRGQYGENKFPKIGETYPAIPITPEDIRRIVREEIERAKDKE